MAASPASRHTGALAHDSHDHARCVADALTKAATLCAKRGARLTALRQRVLEHIWDSHVPVGAYALLDRLRNDGYRAAPPTVYRSLAFLAAEGLIHRIETLNAYIGCGQADRPHQAQYLICQRCGTTAEMDACAIHRAIADQADGAGFNVTRQSVEVLGVCRRCQTSTAHA